MSVSNSKMNVCFLLMGTLLSLSACNGSSETSSQGGSLAEQPGGVSNSGLSNSPQNNTNSTNSSPVPISTPTPTPVPTPTPAPTPSPTNSPTPPPSSSNVVGPSCHSNDSNQDCLALKYVVYTDNSGKPTATQADALSNLTTINSVWKQCNISFQIQQYLAVDPTKYNLTYNTADDSELDTIRKTFEEDSTLLVVTTGTWDRSGSLGNTGANAWTNMPGADFLGAIMEAAVNTDGNIYAHELGHYLNLSHENDTSNLMNPIIYDYSTNLDSSQCSDARSAVNDYWSKMKR